MNVYDNPPSYDTLVADDVAKQSHIATNQQNEAAIATESNLNQPVSKASEDSNHLEPNSAGSSSRQTDMVAIVIEDTSSNTSTPTKGFRLDNDEKGPNSPLTESFCIRMLNDESCGSSANTTLTQSHLANESITEVNDSVFAADNEDTIIVLNDSGSVVETEVNDEKGEYKYLNNNQIPTVSGTLVTDKTDFNYVKNFNGHRKDKSQLKVDLSDGNKTGNGEKSAIATLTVPCLEAKCPTKASREKTGLPDMDTNGNCSYEPQNSKIANQELAFLRNKQVFVDCHERPKDYVLMSCVVMWCCCSPLAVLAFIFSLYVNSSFEKRDYEASRRFSRASFWTSMVAIFVTCLLVVVMLIVFWPETDEDVLENR